jgi:hypothetical protein
MADVRHMHPIDWHSKLNFGHTSTFHSNADLTAYFTAKFPFVYQHTFGADTPWSDKAVRDVVREVDPTGTYNLGPPSSPREQLNRFYWATVGKVVAFHADSDTAKLESGGFTLMTREDADVHEVLARVVASLVNSHPDVRTHITEFPTVGVDGITHCACGSKWELYKDGWEPSCPAASKKCSLPVVRLCGTCKQDRNLNIDDIECRAMCDGTGEEYTANNGHCDCDHHQGGTTDSEADSESESDDSESDDSDDEADCQQEPEPKPGYTSTYASCASYSPTSPCFGPCKCKCCATPLPTPVKTTAKVTGSSRVDVEVESDSESESDSDEEADSANKVSDLYPKTSELARARLCDTCKQDRNLNSDDIECSAMCDGTGEEYTAHNSNCECDHHQGGTGWTTAPTTDSEEEEEEPVRGPSTLARDAKKKMAGVAESESDSDTEHTLRRLPICQFCKAEGVWQTIHGTKGARCPKCFVSVRCTTCGMNRIRQPDKDQCNRCIGVDQAADQPPAKKAKLAGSGEHC